MNNGSTYVHLAVGCSTREIFDYRTVEHEVIKYNCDTGKPIKQKYSETSIYFGDKLLVKPEQSKESILKNFINKHTNLYAHIDGEIIYQEIQQHSQYGATEISLEEMLSAKKRFKKEIHEKLNKLVNPKFYMVSRTEYDW